jgi:peptidoglycan/LPS O-acetylase OafA/YrhL
MTIITPFYLGVFLADLETREDPPLNYLRKNNYFAKLAKFVMFGLAVVWSSEVWLWGFGENLDGMYVMEIGPFFIMVVVLTSDTCKMILETKFMRFMGKISFMMYLIHPLIFEGFMIDFYLFLVWKGTSPVAASIIAFVILTPILLVSSYFLTLYVDIPAKDFAFNMDTYFREERPKKD